MSNSLLNRRILLTDFDQRNAELYEEILLTLTQCGASMLALLNLTTMEAGDLTKKFPKLIPIALNTCRNYQEIRGEEVDVNRVTFEGRLEKKLINSLPEVDYIINFAGPNFVETFVGRSGRAQYRLKTTEFGQIRPLLRSFALIPQEHSHIIIHVVPDLSLGDTLRSSFGMSGSNPRTDKNKGRHYVPGAPEFSLTEDRSKTNQIAALNPYVSGPIILCRSITLRIQRYVETRILRNQVQDINLIKIELKRKENGKLHKRLNQLHSNSAMKFEQQKIKLSKTRANKEEEIHQNFENNATTTVASTTVADPKTAALLEKSRRVRAESKVRRAREAELRDLEKTFDSDLKKLQELFYTEHLRTQGKLILKITTKYAEKLRAIELVTQ